MKKHLLKLTTLLLVLSFLLPQPTQASYATIISDGFEDGNDTGWATNYVCGWGVGSYSGHMQGSYGIRIGGDSTYGPSYIQQSSIDLSSYNLVKVTYYGDTDSMDSTSEKGYFSFSYDGSSWQSNLVSHYNAAYTQHSYTIPPSWLSTTNAIRWRLEGSGCGDYYYIDEIVVQEAQHYSGNCYPPISGSMTINQDCSFSSDPDGVATSSDSITIPSGVTLAVTSAQDIYAGSFELTGGSIALSGILHPGAGTP